MSKKAREEFVGSNVLRFPCGKWIIVVVLLSMVCICVFGAFGEVFVFVFFGLVATVGTTYAATETITRLSIVLGAAAGALACALLVINNLRDIPTDR